MEPPSSESQENHHQQQQQLQQRNVVVMRHGDHNDNFEPLWVTAERAWVPTLVEERRDRAFCTGRKIRNQLEFPIHRVFVSPFHRCVETASQVVSALCALHDDPNNLTGDNVTIDPSKLKVSIEYGLCEMLNTEAIRPGLAPKDGNWGFNISELEGKFSVGTVDNTMESMFEEDFHSIKALYQPFVFPITLLAALVGLHFQTKKLSPVETHFAKILLLIMAAVVHSIAFAWITVQRRNSEYLPLLRLACLGSGVLTCGLLFGPLISNLWWCIVNLCIILLVTVEILCRWRQPIYEYLYHATNLVLASIAELFLHIYQSVCQLRIWIQQKFQSVCFEASQAFSMTHDAVEQENGCTRVAIV